MNSLQNPFIGGPEIKPVGSAQSESRPTPIVPGNVEPAAGKTPGIPSVSNPNSNTETKVSSAPVNIATQSPAMDNGAQKALVEPGSVEQKTEKDSSVFQMLEGVVKKGDLAELDFFVGSSGDPKETLEKYKEQVKEAQASAPTEPAIDSTNNQAVAESVPPAQLQAPPTMPEQSAMPMIKQEQPAIPTQPVVTK